ncbi:DUF7133 domain-containing protein [Maribacter halichondriae]|uniref:DUF7133 domain-containing protein n=1 Tax=Maribacter halichondriae TaxID=2980554 RepID=UPI002359B5A6|nr:c-type cytochrome [Maribacter sp. Hal144]
MENKILKRVGESSGGFKITFDDWGRLFETHNLEHVSHLVFEDRYLDELPVSPAHGLTNISDHDENGLARIYPIGEQETRVNHPEQSGYFSGACGITHYGGGAFPKTFDNTLLVADCVLNLVHMDLLSANGSSLKASRVQQKSDFLASTDRSFRPVNMAVSPNGALYVLDMHREVIEHPEWIPDELEVDMDLDAGKEKGRIYRIVPKEGLSPIDFELTVDDPKSLVKALGSKNQWTRNTAQRLIVINKMVNTVDLLIEQVKNTKNSLARLHGLWALQGLGKLKTPELKRALQDSVAEIRENAIKVAEERLNSNLELADEIMILLRDSNPRVRMQASLTMSTLNEENYFAKKEKLGSIMSDVISNEDNDIWAVRAIASSLQRQAFPFSLQVLNNERADLNRTKVEVLSLLFEKLGKNHKANELANLTKILQENQFATSAKSKLLTAVATGWRQGSGSEPSIADTKALANALNLVESENDVVMIRAAGAIRKAAGLPASTKVSGFMKTARTLVFDEELSTVDRLDQLKLLAFDDFDNKAAILYGLLNNKKPLVLQKEALAQLESAGSQQVAKHLLELWPGLGPQARKIAADILLYKSYNHDALLTAMENGTVNLGEFNLDLERRRTLLMWSEKDIQERAKKLFSDGGIVQRKEAIEKMRPALALQGNMSSGAVVFKAQCASCHRYGSEGEEVGPMLTEVNRKSKESLLYDILDPNAAVDTKYLNHQVKTEDGDIITGLVFKETDTEIGLKMMGGQEKIIPKSKIDQFSSLGVSMMFEGLEANINQQEMADLLAFLQQSNNNL